MRQVKRNDPSLLAYGDIFCTPYDKVSGCIVEAAACFDSHVEISSAMGWLSATMRHPSDEDLSFSSAIFQECNPEVGFTSGISIHLSTLSPLRGERLCWHDLFARTILTT